MQVVLQRFNMSIFWCNIYTGMHQHQWGEQCGLDDARHKTGMFSARQDTTPSNTTLNGECFIPLLFLSYLRLVKLLHLVCYCKIEGKRAFPSREAEAGGFGTVQAKHRHQIPVRVTVNKAIPVKTPPRPTPQGHETNLGFFSHCKQHCNMQVLLSSHPAP